MKIRLKIALLAALAGVLLMAVPAAMAQQQEIRFYSKDGKKQVAPSEAYYYHVVEYQPDGSAISTRYTAGDSVKVSLYSFSDINGGKYREGIKDGPFYYYHPNGDLAAAGNYKNDQREGEYKSWYKNKQLRYQEYYLNGERQDTLRGYYENGQLRRLETYAAGKLVTGEVFEMDGSPAAYFPIEQMPQFPGGDLALLNWLSGNIKYPKKAYKAKAQGVVIISYIVEKDGKITNTGVVKGFHPDADAEALRVVNSMPDWQPGLQEGKPVPVRYTLPVRFSIYR